MRKLRLLLVASALLVPSLAVPVARAETGSATLTASSPLVVFGDSFTLAGAVTDEALCIGGRAVNLEWRPADSSAFAIVAQGTTAEDGSFSFPQSQSYVGRYRATLPQDGGCSQVVSSEALVRVRALVDSTLLAASLTAGSCVDVSATVSPPKPGQGVELQRRRPDGWQTVDELVLDDASSASARPCFGFEDIGVLRLRVLWPQQDLLNEANAGPTLPFEITQAPWMERIGDLVGGRAVSVSVLEQGEYLYRRADAVARTPASNEKLLLSMAMLDAFGPGFRITTRAAAAVETSDGVVPGDLWILGRGDPEVGRETMAALARRIAAAGVTRIAGRVLGATTFFHRDWYAPGWDEEARDFVNRPTALTFEGNAEGDPERLAARSLTIGLEKLGVNVAGDPGAGVPPSDLTPVASVPSRTLGALLRRMLRPSDNFYAEVLGKRLGARAAGAPGTIAKGAAAICSWAADRGVSFTCNDDSGLSYDNAVTAEGLVALLGDAEAAAWGAVLRRALPTGGQGTLRARLENVRVRAKTGTLEGVSALSGWVWLEKRGTWAEFSILSAGMDKSAASDLEDRVVRILQNFVR